MTRRNDDARHKQVVTYVTEQEHAAIKQAAHLSQRTISDYARLKLLANLDPLVATALSMEDWAKDFTKIHGRPPTVKEWDARLASS